jgi:hypothetical protein
MAAVGNRLTVSVDSVSVPWCLREIQNGSVQPQPDRAAVDLFAQATVPPVGESVIQVSAACILAQAAGLDLLIRHAAQG